MYNQVMDREPLDLLDDRLIVVVGVEFPAKNMVFRLNQRQPNGTLTLVGEERFHVDGAVLDGHEEDRF
jgi:hypothetical protein